MPLLSLTRDVPLSAEQAWSRITDWVRHGDFVPMTTVRVHERRIVARTGLGPFAFDDVMDIVVWEPPQRCRLEKRGWLVQGWAEITVEQVGEGARVRWVEEIRVRGLPRGFDPVAKRAGERMFGRLLDGLLGA